MAAVSLLLASPAFAAETEANRFVKVAESDVGGHFFSQVVYAPAAKALVSWGTRTHAHKIRAHEVQHFLVGEDRWIDAFPAGAAEQWAGDFKQWPDWDICETRGAFYERDGVKMPEPTNSFYQVCWDDHNRRLVFYVASMTFSYEPVGRTWKLIHDASVKEQPPALLLWSSLCYDPVNKQVLLFGGGGVDRADGRPHTWALDVTTDRWRKLDLEVEPPARCNSRMVYDSKHQLIVLFGGDGQDRALADTWVFDVKTQTWSERKPPVSPYPRSCHGLAYLEKSGVVLLVGGKAVADYRDVKRLSNQVWAYDAGKNTWSPVAAEIPEMDGSQWSCIESVPGTDEALLVVTSKYDHRQKTYRFRYDPSTPPAKIDGVAPGTMAYKTERTKQWYDDQPPGDREQQAKILAELPDNEWVEMKPPKSTAGRTWGSAIFDTDRGVAMKWGGGHSGYQGTDMAFYDVATNRFTIDRTPAFTPEPFDRWARRPAGRTFFNQPWARHMRHTCAYDPIRKLGVFTDAGGSDWYDREANEVVKHTWLCDPTRREWLEPIPQPFPGGGTYSPIAIPTPQGVLAYQNRQRYEPEQLYRFVGEAGQPDTWGWEEIEIVGDARPRRNEHMTIVYDQKRDRLVFLSASEDQQPELWFLSLKDRRWIKNPKPAPGGVSTREAVYIPDQDAILAYGPAHKDDPIWARVYLCAENRWVPLRVGTPQFIVHEVALEYDPVHRVAVLLWPPRFEQDIRPHLLRLNARRLIGKAPSAR
ncbi:MAG: kelch repeat-containing protein [Pirellulaceae bacterium]